MTLQEYIIKFREDHGLSQRQFSALAGLSNSYLSIIENNYNPKTSKPPIISLLTIKKLAGAMGLSLQELTDIIDNQPVGILGRSNRKRPPAEPGAFSWVNERK